MSTVIPKPYTRKRSKSNSNAGNIKVGDIVLLQQARVGVVRYVGHVDGKSKSSTDKYIGVEIRITDGVLGDNDGTFNNQTYFKCAKDVGLFVVPHQIIQMYTPEDLLEMVIELKDTLLPLFGNSKNERRDSKDSPTSPYYQKIRHLSNGDNNLTIGWSNPPKLQEITEDAANSSCSSLKSRSPSGSPQVRWNVQIDSIVSSSSSPPPNPNNIAKEMHKYKKSEYDADIEIAAPTILMDHFSEENEENDEKTAAINVNSLFLVNALSANPGKHSVVKSRISIIQKHIDNNSLLSSFSNLKLLHRCVSLRIKADKTKKNGKKVKKKKMKSLLLDLADFGEYLKNEEINDKHKWNESIWNKYDKLFKLKIDFYFVNELLSDLLNEYLLNEYKINIGQIMRSDIKKAIQQIIVHIRPYHIEQHQQMEMDLYDVDDSENELLPFTFNDFCNLGNWLYDLVELEEDDDIEDYFTMDIHYFDFVQYVNSHRNHIWKKVINKLINNNKNVITKFGLDDISNVIESILIDYGRNGLGNVNMKIYTKQIKQYTQHLTKLFNECKKEVINKSNSNKKRKFVTKKEFFQFISVIPSL